MVKGIYKITNNRSGEVYIGQSTDIDFRKNTHFRELNQRKHHNSGMQNDYSSGDTFSFEIIEELPDATKADLYNKESYYIKKYNSFREGYNQTPGGAMDQFKGKYEYGGGRLPFEKYKPTQEYIVPPNINNDISTEIEQKKPNFRKTKIIGIFSGIIAIFCLIVYIDKYPIFGALTGSMGLAFTILFTIIACICGCYLKEKTDKAKTEYEKKRVKQKLNENSIYLEDRIINLVLFLNENAKQLFCQAYNISNKNEDILKFISENWISSSDILKDEMRYLAIRLSDLTSPNKNFQLINLRLTLPKSIIHNVLIRDNYTCQKCGKNLLEFETKKELHNNKPSHINYEKFENETYIDLIKPLEEGGTLTEDNLITACKKSCDSYFVPTKEVYEIYENTVPNFDQKFLKIERNGLSFKFPDNYLVAKIPDNCPDCTVALTKNDGKCDILVEVSEDPKLKNQFNSLKYMKYVKRLSGFYDIKQLYISDLNRTRWNIPEPDNKSCFIAISDSGAYSNKKGIIKSIIFFDFNHYGKTVRITLNSLLEDKYNCMNDLYVIVNTLKFMK